MLKKILKNHIGSLVLLVVIVVLVVIFSMPSNNEIIKEEEDVNVTNLIDKINDNYTMSITMTNSMESTTYNYSTDSNITLFDRGDYSEEEFLIYRDNTYLIDQNNHKLNKTNKIDFLKNPFINLELIKKLFIHCELEYINDTNSLCVINTNDYIKEYNNVYNTNYEGNNKNMNINVTYYTTRIYSITLDYTEVDKIINNGNDILKYELKFSNINANNYSDIKEYYGKILK